MALNLQRKVRPYNSRNRNRYWHLESRWGNADLALTDNRDIDIAFDDTVAIGQRTAAPGIAAPPVYVIGTEELIDAGTEASTVVLNNFDLPAKQRPFMTYSPMRCSLLLLLRFSGDTDRLR